MANSGKEASLKDCLALIKWSCFFEDHFLKMDNIMSYR